MKFLNSKFLKSAFNEKDYPPLSCPEFAFVGRSNVGKSSLLNALTNNKIAKVSSSPGKTKLINFFSINNDTFRIVDLPGYGFAKISKKERETFNRIIDTYLKSRMTLKKIILLLDIRREKVSEDDILMLNYISYYKKDGIIVFTKCDKLSKNEISKNEKSIKKSLVDNNINIDNTIFLPTSSLKRDGINNLFNTLGKNL